TRGKYEAHHRDSTKNKEHNLFHGVSSGSKETRCQCQAHHGHCTKNNENDALHGVSFFLNRRSWHWNPPFVCTSRCWYQYSIALPLCAFFTDHPLPYVRPAMKELDSFLLTGI